MKTVDEVIESWYAGYEVEHGLSSRRSIHKQDIINWLAEKLLLNKHDVSGRSKQLPTINDRIWFDDDGNKRCKCCAQMLC